MAAWRRDNKKRVSGGVDAADSSIDRAALPPSLLRRLRRFVRCLHEVRLPFWLFAVLFTHGMRLLLVALDLFGVGEFLVAYVALHDIYLLDRGLKRPNLAVQAPQN